MSQRCYCGTHELTKDEERTLPELNGKRFCFLNCVRHYADIEHLREQHHEHQLELALVESSGE